MNKRHFNFWNGALVSVFVAALIFAMADSENIVTFVMTKAASIACLALMFRLRTVWKQQGKI